MCLSRYSTLELLKEVAKNLFLSEEYGYINGLSEKKLAELINNFYQVRYTYNSIILDFDLNHNINFFIIISVNFQ